jgi:hypothetical protein
MLSRMLGPLLVTCLGLVVLFVFFSALGEVSPGDVLWPTIVVGVFAALFVGHSLWVRHHLREHGNQDMFRTASALRERRGF